MVIRYVNERTLFKARFYFDIRYVGSFVPTFFGDTRYFHLILRALTPVKCYGTVVLIFKMNLLRLL